MDGRGATPDADNELAMLRAIVDQSPDATYIRDLEGRLLMVNAAGLRGLGLAAEDVIGRRPDEVMPRPIADRIKESDEVVLASGETLTYERRMRNLSGFEATYLVSKYLYRGADGQVKGFVGILRDISELKRLQDTLTEQNERLVRVDRQKSEFVSALSHELRTPLTFIKGYVEFLEDRIAGPLTDGQADYVLQVQLGIERLERLVNDLLDFARMDAGTFKLVRATGDVRTTIETTVSLLQPAIEQAGLRAELSLPEVPLTACVDAQRIGQVVTNLVTNAVKFTPRGRAIAIRAWKDAGRVVCEVEDAGPGITRSDQGRLFQRFSQLDIGSERGGLGLGLSISKALVEAHGGAIGVRSEVGAGSVFWFSVPVEAALCGDGVG